MIIAPAYFVLLSVGQIWYQYLDNILLVYWPVITKGWETLIQITSWII